MNNQNTSIKENKLPTLTIQEFRALPPEQKRVAICRDALAQIQARWFIAETNKYFELDEVGLRSSQGCELRDVILQSTEPCTVCAIGAIFASIVRLDDSFSIRSPDYQTLSSDDFDRSRSFGFYHSYGRDRLFGDKLARSFEPRELALMEVAFERTGRLADRALQMGDEWNSCNSDRDNIDGAGDWADDDERESDDFTPGNPQDIALVKRALAFGDEYAESEENRLVAILQNVIDHNGTFVP